MTTIPKETLVLLASLYEELEYNPTLLSPAVVRAELMFRSECRRLYEAEPPTLREQMNLDKYIAAVVIPDVLRHIESAPARPSA